MIIDSAKKMHRDIMETRQYRKARSDLIHLYEVATRGREGRLGSIIGPSGIGKSTLVEDFCQDISAESVKSGEKPPFLRIKVPPKPSLRSFYEHLLKALGAPCAPRDTNEDRRVRILQFIKKLGIRIIILDEFQHLAKTAGSDQMGVCDVLKSLMNDGQVGIIVVGILEAEAILQQDEQILRRRYLAIRLYPFCDPQNLPASHDNKSARSADVAEFKAVIKNYAKGFGCPDTTYILEDEVAERLLVYTRGTFGRIVNFIEASAKDATCRNKTGIDEEAICATIRSQNLNLEATYLPFGPEGSPQVRARAKKPKAKMEKDERRFLSSTGHYRSDKLGQVER